MVEQQRSNSNPNAFLNAMLIITSTSTWRRRYASLRGTKMTPEQKAVFESIVSFVHRAAMEVAELPKAERAGALKIVHQSIAQRVAEIGIAEPELIEICTKGIATVLHQIEASGSPSGGHA